VAGDFEGYLSFGIGLAARGGYHVSSLTGPDRVVIDFSHPLASRRNGPGLVTLVPGGRWPSPAR